MLVNAALGDALERIADRAADVRRAFTGGSIAGDDRAAATDATAEFTLDPLCVAAPQGAYFVSRDAAGAIAYSANGSFVLDGGLLRDAFGSAVTGTVRGVEGLSTLAVDSVDAALGRARDPRIESDGSFVYDRETIEPRTGTRETQRVVAGRIALARFPAGTHPVQLPDGRIAPPPGVVPHVGVPGDGSFGAVQPNRRAGSAVDLDASLARLKEAYVAFDALQAAATARGHLGKTAMDLVK